MRLFVSIPVPGEIKETALGQAAEPLKEEPLRWIKPENLHLTLKFLGEVEEQYLDDLRLALADTALRHRAFSISLSSIGAFPGRSRARVVWAGVEAGAPELRRLAADIEQTLHALGYEKEQRPYTPHLTLARARYRPLRLELEGLDLITATFETRHFELVQSVPGPGGVSYRTLKRWPLEGD